MKIQVVIYLLLYSDYGLCEGYNILILAPFSAKSHTAVVQSVSLELINRGHHVTIITRNLVMNPPDNYRQIQVDEFQNLDNINVSEVFRNSTQNSFARIKLMWEYSIMLLENTLNTEAVIDFIQNDYTNFDLIISEAFYQEALYMFAHKYKAPLVLLETSSLSFDKADFMGISPSLSYALHDYYSYDNGDSLTGKLINAMIIIFQKIGRKYIYLPQLENLANKYFACFEQPLPKIQDLERNVSLLLLNTHFSFDQIIPTVPGIVEIGGIHLGSSNELPKDIQTFLDEAENGVIYFALGSILKSCMMEPDKINAFIEVFQEMNQSILWKWEDDNPHILKNALLRKWLPQFDILSHPNVKLFITHGGMLGTQEAIYHGVPLVGMPIYADQYMNMIKLIKHKAAVKLIYSDINAATIRDALNQVLYDQDYQKNMRLLSERYRDRMVEPMDTAMYWIEYVIRHEGLVNLKSPMPFMGFWEYYFIEIFLFSFIILMSILFYLLYELISKCIDTPIKIKIS